MSVYLKECMHDDFEQYYEIRCERTDIYWMGYEEKPNKKKLESIFLQRIGRFEISDFSARKIYFIVDDSIEDEVVGFVQIMNQNGKIEIGYSVKEKYQGRGIATRAISCVLCEIDKYNVEVFARIRDDNKASQMVCLKNGFERSDCFEERNFPCVGMVKFRKYIFRK